MRIGNGSLGVFVPGHFTIPQNPFFMTATDGMAGMGDFVPGAFTVPQNPFFMRGNYGMAGCGCAKGMAGVVDDVKSMVSGNFQAVDKSTYMILGGAVLAIMLLSSRSGRSEYRSRKSLAKAKYKNELAKARAAHPTVASRAKRAVSAF